MRLRAAASLALLAPASALVISEDARAYWLLDPAPRDKLRELMTDRPDKTEAPYTVDAGHFQVEMDVANLTIDNDTGQRSRFFFAPNVKAGLTDRADLQLIFGGYTQNADRRGYGDTYVRLKVNLIGNEDGSPIGVGIMPYIKLPTAGSGLGNDRTEGGLIGLYGFRLPHSLYLGLMTEVDRAADAYGGGGGYHYEYVSTVTVGSPLYIGELNGYVELFSLSSAESGAPWIATFDVGLTYLVTPMVQLDAGVNLGMTEAADDYNPFMGVSFKY